MKPKALTIFAIIISLGAIGLVFFHIQNSQFALSPEYYGTSEIETISLDDLQTLIGDRKSFGLFVSQPACQASADFERHLDEFLTAQPLKFYEISFSTLKDSQVIPDLHFYPSFVIFHDGKVVDFLEANSDEDAAAYTSADGFSDWFTHYVKTSI